MPAVIKRLYGFSVRKETVYRWITKGRTLKAGGKTGYLASHTIAGRVFVKLADLKAFLRAT